MKWIKRIFVTLLVLTIGASAFFGTTYYLSKRKPAWYKPLALNSHEMDAAANRAMNKVLLLHNMASQASSVETSRKWRQANVPPRYPPFPRPPSLLRKRN